MEGELPPEFHFGLPEEIEAVLASDVDDWDEWQMEDMVAEALFALQARQAAESAARSPVDAEMMSATLSFVVEESEWGIDEPLTAADFIFLFDEDNL